MTNPRQASSPYKMTSRLEITRPVSSTITTKILSREGTGKPFHLISAFPMPTPNQPPLMIPSSERCNCMDPCNGSRDPLQGSMQLQRSLEGIIKGGWFGVGIGKADIKWNGLPVPSRDSIFVVIVEETGLVISSLLV